MCTINTQGLLNMTWMALVQYCTVCGTDEKHLQKNKSFWKKMLAFNLVWKLNVWCLKMAHCWSDTARCFSSQTSSPVRFQKGLRELVRSMAHWKYWVCCKPVVYILQCSCYMIILHVRAFVTFFIIYTGCRAKTYIIFIIFR